MISILPYTEMNGAMTVPDSRMKAIARKIIDAKDNNFAFCELPIRDEEHFLQIFKRSDRKLSYVMRVNDQDAAIFWLENFRGASAEMGFAVIQDVMHLRVFDAGKKALDYIFSLQADGEQAVETVWGICNEHNKKAIKYLEAIGLKRLGTMPAALFDYRAGEIVDGVILYKHHCEGKEDGI